MRRATALAVALAIAAALGACGGSEDGEAAAHPVLADLAPALAALDPATDLYMVATSLDRVEIVVSDGDQAVGYTFADGNLSEADPLGEASGNTFRPADIDVDVEHVFDQLTEDLGEPAIVRFEVIGGGAAPLYSAQVLSDAGGTLVIDLSESGDVLGVAPLADN